MRIGYDGTPLIGSLTGVGWYTYELVRAVAEASPGDQLALFPISWRRAALVQAPAQPNVRVLRRFAPARPLWELWRLTGRPSLEWFVRCDVFHATNFMAPPARRTPVVVTVHDLSFVRMPHTCTPAVRRWADLLPAVLRRASAIIAVSRFTAEEIAQWQPALASRVTVVHNAPRRRTATDGPSGIPDGPPYALMVGVDPRKNVPLALDALRILRGRGVELRLVCGGPPSPLVDLDALVRDRGLASEDVVRTGYIDDARVSALLRDAAMLWHVSTYEGFGLPPVEAMRAGCPVVAVDAGPTREIAADAALLTPADAEAVADAAERVLADGDLRHTLIERGRVRGAAFTWARAATETLRVYRAVTGAGSRP